MIILYTKRHVCTIDSCVVTLNTVLYVRREKKRRERERDKYRKRNKDGTKERGANGQLRRPIKSAFVSLPLICNAICRLRRQVFTVCACARGGRAEEDTGSERMYSARRTRAGRLVTGTRCTHSAVYAYDDDNNNNNMWFSLRSQHDKNRVDHCFTNHFFFFFCVPIPQSELSPPPLR